MRSRDEVVGVASGGEARREEVHCSVKRTKGLGGWRL